MFRKTFPTHFLRPTLRKFNPAATQESAGPAKTIAEQATEAAKAAAAAAEEGGKQKVRVKFMSGYAERQVTQQKEKGNFFSAFMSVGIISLGCSFLFVPLFKMYCSTTGQGADPKFYTTESTKAREETDKKYPIKKKLLRIRFLSDVGNTMPIAFVPLQKNLEVLVGEPALAFYSAYNRSNRTILGVASYNIAPPDATNYLNKIQCFCFEEQRFKPHELVEMPVFFYIDRDYMNDPLVSWLDELILNYTFFNLERTRESIFRTA